MSQTNISPEIRSALWTTYKGKCFYCNKILEYAEMHIDHIIPESTVEEVLETIIKEYGLPYDFQDNDLRNLVPTHSNCNTRKSDQLFDKQAAMYYLQLTQAKMPKLKAEIEKVKMSINRSKLLAKVDVALSENLVHPKDLQQLIWDIKQENWSNLEIKLSLAVEFVDAIYDTFYLNKDCSSLYDKKLVVHSDKDYISLINDEGYIKKVATLRQWKEETENGYFPLDNTTIKLASSFTFLDELLKAIHTAKMPQVSYVSNPRIELTDLYQLSANLVPDPYNELTPFINNNTSVGELVDQGRVKSNPWHMFYVCLEHDGMEVSFMEQFRADFNDDGIEDIFVRGWQRSIEGTLGFGFTTILTKYSKNHLIEEVLT